jgi:hypothetical protein
VGGVILAYEVESICLFLSYSARLSRCHKIQPQIPDYKSNGHFSAGFEIIITVTMKITTFWDMKLELP